MRYPITKLCTINNYRSFTVSVWAISSSINVFKYNEEITHNHIETSHGLTAFFQKELDFTQSHRAHKQLSALMIMLVAPFSDISPHILCFEAFQCHCSLSHQQQISQ
jgi:hypothetical protein